MEKNEINVSPAKLMPSGNGLFWGIDQPQVNHLGAGPFKLPANLLRISF